MRRCLQLLFARDHEEFEKFLDKRARIPGFVSQFFGVPQIFLKSFLEMRGKHCVVDDKVDFFINSEGTVPGFASGLCNPEAKKKHWS